MTARFLIFAVLIAIVFIVVISFVNMKTLDSRSQASTYSDKTMIVNVLGDSYVNKSYPKSNYGTQETLVVDQDMGRNAYVLFDLSPYAGETVKTATFTFKIKERSLKPINFFAVASTDWSESTLMYNNRPTVGSTIATKGTTVKGEVVSLDLTSYVRQNLGKKMSFAIGSSSSDGVAIYSKDSSYKPSLKVVFGSGPVTSTATPAPTTTMTPKPTMLPTTTAVPTKIPTPMPSGTPYPTPSASPLPPVSSVDFGPIALSYRQGGMWLTPEEINQIPMNNASWDSLVSYAKRPMDIVGEITCTAGGSCTSDTNTPAAMYARAIVGLRTNNSTMISELRSELDRVEAAVNKAIDQDKNLDDKWPERNLGYVAVAANAINYRPQSLQNGLRKALYTTKFEEDYTIETLALTQLPNKPSYGRWSLLTAAYLLEDWSTVNKVAQVHGKAMGEKNWAGTTNTVKLSLTGLGLEDNWQTLQPGGKANPVAVMPSSTYYQDHGVGGLYLADQYRAANGPQWPPAYTDYIFEGMSPNVAVAFGLDHLGYKNVFSLGNYALLRSLLFAYSSHDGKSQWNATGNDTWLVAATMTWAKGQIGSTLPDSLKPEPTASVPWPLPVTASGVPGRGMGFMYATHYARLAQ